MNAILLVRGMAYRFKKEAIQKGYLPAIGIRE
jgi:hypothetical protein